jgi:hypothetical protein
MVIRGVGSADRLAEETRCREWQTPGRRLKPTPRGLKPAPEPRQFRAYLVSGPSPWELCNIYFLLELVTIRSHRPRTRTRWGSRITVRS